MGTETMSLYWNSLEIFLQQRADAFMDSHGADNGFHAGCAQQMESGFQPSGTGPLQKMVDRCMASVGSPLRQCRSGEMQDLSASLWFSGRISATSLSSANGRKVWVLLSSMLLRVMMRS